MTRDEAIKVLNDWDGYFIGHSSDDVNEALDMAIKALEQLQELKDMISAETTIITDEDGYEWRVVQRKDLDEVLGKGWDK